MQYDESDNVEILLSRNDIFATKDTTKAYF